MWHRGAEIADRRIQYPQKFSNKKNHNIRCITNTILLEFLPKYFFYWYLQDHPNIIKVYEVFQDKDYLYIVTELCLGGELFDRIVELKHFGEKEAADVMYQVLNAINYLHKNKVVHRDLKPENLLLESKNS